jgi:hypothetical protein
VAFANLSVGKAVTFTNLELAFAVADHPVAIAVTFDAFELALLFAEDPVVIVVVSDSPKPEAMRSPKLLPTADPVIAKQRRPEQSFRKGFILRDPRFIEWL